MFKFYVCLNTYCIFVLPFFLVDTFFMTAIEYIYIFFILFCRLALVKYVLSLTIILQQPVTAAWLVY
jgi:hypothetical protein